MPDKLEIPVDAPRFAVVLLQGVDIDHLYHGTHELGLVAPDPVEQGLQPSLNALAVTVHGCTPGYSYHRTSDHSEVMN